MAESLISKICGTFSPISSLRTNEQDLVSEVLHVVQGLPGSLFYWDQSRRRYRVKSGIYLTHLSYTSLYQLLDHLLYAASCLKLVEIALSRLDHPPSPTLRAFSFSVSAWLRKLRDIALKEETNIVSYAGLGVIPTLLGLTASLSSLCSGAEYLFQIVAEAVPHVFCDPALSIPPAEIAVHILDHLYKKLDEVCLVQGGEEEAYRMLVHILVGTLLPYVEVLDSWLFGGTLDDPFEEMFFYANSTISVDDADFWEKSYLLRVERSHKLNTQLPAMTDCVPAKTDGKSKRAEEFASAPGSVKGKEHKSRYLVCPLFVKDIAHSIVSAGKSLQLMSHVLSAFSVKAGEHLSERHSDDRGGFGCSDGDASVSNVHKWQSMAGFTLSEMFCLSLVNLIGHGGHISKYFGTDGWCKPEVLDVVDCRTAQALPASKYLGEICQGFVPDRFFQEKERGTESVDNYSDNLLDAKEHFFRGAGNAFAVQRSFCPENPVITVCQDLLDNNRKFLRALNLSRRFDLPPLNDEDLRRAVYGEEADVVSGLKGTDYAFGFQFLEATYHHAQCDSKLLEVLFPFPTLLPSFEDDLQISALLPFQKNSTLCSRILSCLHCLEPQISPLPMVIMQECFNVYVRKQVDYIGSLILSKLIGDWRLMEELAVLRAIYLLGSGDLLQHFLTVVFNKLDNGETWHDDFELNTLLQESLRNSADGIILSSPDLLVVSIAKNHGDSNDQSGGVAISSTHKGHHRSFGIDGLDSLKFTYKVSWPLEIIANTEAIKKYNQVMGFLLKVKRAKFVLDKARRWMWKDKCLTRNSRKRHWLVEQKLLHFVDAFHQYVMDRVYHSAWRELCEGMAAAGSLDEVIEVHETYLLSIHRQCFVVPDKLWALIASRINSILGLALDFHSIQQTLSNGGAVSAVKARCEVEVDRIEKQFDDCMAFLLRVLSFKLNVGHFPHLADLVTRINYNYFYMSDGGNLKMATGSETANSRLGSSFQA